MRVLVTGADGFAGRYLVRHLEAQGHEVFPVVRGKGFELDGSVAMDGLFAHAYDGIVHLAAMASSTEARKDPAAAWNVNTVGTVRLLEAAARARYEGKGNPTVLMVSSSEVYGSRAVGREGGTGRSRREEDPVAPVSPYGATKAAAEIGALEVWRRTGLKVIIARAFQHTGPGQAENYVVPALAKRLALAKRAGAAAINTGNLEPVRDISDVRDVVAAYAALLERGEPGETYNVCSGHGVPLFDVFDQLSTLIGCRARAEADASLVRPGEIAHLVGDNSKLKAATGWSPAFTLDQTLRDVVDAQAD